MIYNGLNRHTMLLYARNAASVADAVVLSVLFFICSDRMSGADIHVIQNGAPSPFQIQIVIDELISLNIDWTNWIEETSMAHAN